MFLGGLILGAFGFMSDDNGGAWIFFLYRFFGGRSAGFLQKQGNGRSRGCALEVYVFYLAFMGMASNTGSRAVGKTDRQTRVDPQGTVGTASRDTCTQEYFVGFSSEADA